MNKSILTVLLISAAVGFSSCGSSDAPVKDTSIMPAQDSVKAMAPAMNTMPMPANNAVDLAPTNANGARTVPINQAPIVSAGAGMNPEHGLPGHRCDIAVGAPLNSSPGNTTAPAPSPAPVMTTNPTPAPVMNIPGAVGKANPPHGQPGHDCAVAVGAPLKN